MSVNAFFIGGPADGSVLLMDDADRRSFWRVPVIAPYSTTIGIDYRDTLNSAIAYKTATYKLQLWASTGKVDDDRTEWRIFAYEDMTSTDVFRRIIEFYTSKMNATARAELLIHALGANLEMIEAMLCCSPWRAEDVKKLDHVRALLYESARLLMKRKAETGK